MARYQKLLIVLPLGLAAIVMVLYNYPLADWYLEQNQPAYAVSESEQAVENQARDQKNLVDAGDQEEQSNIEVQLITNDSQDITTASNNITVSGWVGTEFGENIAFETVELFSPSQKTYHSIVTGPSGDFKFTDLKPGSDYVLNVSPQGMFKRYTKSQIKLRFDQEVHNIVLESIPLGILSGRIVDPYDRPVTGINLLIQAVETVYWTTSVMTDANGSFSVAEFPKGRFQVVTKGKHPVATNWTHQAATKGQHLLRVTGLNFDPVIAVPVNLTIDLGPYNLGGRIYDESGQTFDGADVFLIWTLNESGVRIRSTRKASADANGEFRFTELGPGEHELIVSAWRGSTFKQTVKQIVNLGVDSGELIIVFNTLQD
jgi:hypothetical protein